MTVWSGDTAAFCAAGWEAPARTLMAVAFEGDFSDDDWRHGLGGRHFVVHEHGALLAHASVVPRRFVLDGQRLLRVGYVEAVAVAPARRREGLGRRAMLAAAGHIRTAYDLGALSTGQPAFYEQLGWRRWEGRTWVDAPEGRRRTADEDDGVLVLLTDRTTGLDLCGDIACDWREGDVW